MHTQRGSTSKRNHAIPRYRMAWRTALLSAVCVAAPSSQSHAQSAEETPSPVKLVRAASYNDLHSSSSGHLYRYRVQTVEDGKQTTKEVIETRDGDMSRLLEVDGKPLDAEAEAKERARLEKLRDNPDEQARRHRKSQAESGRSDEMVRLLPDAFRYTYIGMVAGPNGPCYRLRFEPNPAFQPPDREAEVYHGMAGEIWIDQGQQRIAKLDARLISDVDFGWGVVGRLLQGGTILVEEQDVGYHRWETIRQDLHLSGKILLVKPLRIESTEKADDFQPVPDQGYQAAIAFLLNLPSK